MCVMLQAVQGLHAQGRAHCDVNPSNVRVLLSKEWQVLQCTLHGLAGSIVHEGKLKAVALSLPAILASLERHMQAVVRCFVTVMAPLAVHSLSDK